MLSTGGLSVFIDGDQTDLEETAVVVDMTPKQFSCLDESYDEGQLFKILVKDTWLLPQNSRKTQRYIHRSKLYNRHTLTAHLVLLTAEDRRR